MELKIGKTKIGSSNKVFVIAELSCNHLNKYDLAVKTIKAMKEAGADAVKIQTYTPDTLTINHQNKYFKIKGGTLWDGKTLYQLYKEAYTPWEWQPKLKKYAESLGLICFSSPFDKTAVDFLEKLKVPAYKIASFEITDIPLIEYVASKKKPIIISTGVAKLDEIYGAINACKKMGNNKIALLKCTSSYPAPYEEMNLNTICDMVKKFKRVVGLSDHSLGSSAAIASVALGAKIIEKHFILNRKLGGPDAAFSMEPAEFKKMVDSIREAEKALGKVEYKLSAKTKKSRIFSRSLFAVSDIKKDELFTEENTRSIRPHYGLEPKYLPKVLGKKAGRNILKGTPISWKLIK